MTSQEYSKLIDLYSAQWRESPRAYQRGLNLFAFLGVVALIVTFVIGILLILTLRPFAVLAGGVILFSIVRAMFFKPEPVGGIPVDRATAPELIADVDEISRKLGAKKCDGVRVDFEFNARAVQFHRWGIIGPVENYVVLGVPLLDAMERQHIRSTIAHEIGHLQLKHGVKARRWFAMVEMYEGLRRNMEGGLLWLAFGPFIKWYVPRFYARLQPISLKSEFEADALEATVTSPKIAGESLCLLAVGSPKFGDAITDYCKTAVTNDSHLGEELAELVHEKLRDLPAEDVTETLANAMLRATDIEGSHPSLSERLAALGVTPSVPDSIPVSASEAYFGQRRQKIAAEAAQDYIDHSEDYAGLAHTLVRASELSELQAKIDSGECTAEEAEEFIHAMGVSEGSERVLPIIEMYASKYPESAALRYYKGMMFLRENDDRGIEELQKAVAIDPSQTARVSELIYQHLLSRGRAEEAASFRRQRDEFADRVRALYEKRLKIPKDVQYESHDFHEHEIEGIGSVLVQVKTLGSAYLAKRVTENAPVVIYDLSIFPKRFGVVVDGNALTTEIEEALRPLERCVAVFFGPWLDKGVQDRIKSVPRSLIYDRDDYLAKQKEESRSASN